MIIVCASVKGGVGKSTIAANLTVLRTIRGERVLLVDGDQQATVSDWVQHRENQGRATDWITIKLSGPAVRTEVLKLKENYDHVIIDVGGRDTQSLRASLCVADVALIPCPPRSFDLWSMEQLSQLIQEARCVNPNLQAKVFVNMGDARNADNISAQEILKDIQGIEVLNVVIGQRKAFSNATADGGSIAELRPKSNHATNEIETLERLVFDVSLASV